MNNETCTSMMKMRSDEKTLAAHDPLDLANVRRTVTYEVFDIVPNHVRQDA